MLQALLGVVAIAAFAAALMMPGSALREPGWDAMALATAGAATGRSVGVSPTVDAPDATRSSASSSDPSASMEIASTTGAAEDVRRWYFGQAATGLERAAEDPGLSTEQREKLRCLAKRAHDLEKKLGWHRDFVGTGDGRRDWNQFARDVRNDSREWPTKAKVLESLELLAKHERAVAVLAREIEKISAPAASKGLNGALSR